MVAVSLKKGRARTNMNKEKKGFLGGVIIGGIVGSIAALLYAPKSGKETREELCNKLDKAKDELGHKIQEAKKTGSEQTKELIAKGEQLQKDLAKKSNELKKSGKKVGKVAVDESKSLARQASDLTAELSKSTKKVVKQSRREVDRLREKAAKDRAKKDYILGQKPSDKK